MKIKPCVFILVIFIATGLPAVSQALPGFEYTISSNLEYRYRSAELPVESYKGKSGIDFYRDHWDRPSLLGVYLGLGYSQGLRVEVEAQLRRQWSLQQGFTSWNLPPFGISGNPVAIENGIIECGLLAWNSPEIEISLGRQKIDYSNGLKGALLPSPRIPSLDSFKFHGEIGALGIDWLISSIRALQAIDGFDVKPNDVSPATSGAVYYYGFENGSAWLGDTDRLGSPTTILSALHRFTWDFGTADLGLSAHVMYSRRNNRFTILDLMPVISWHQAIMLQINMSMILDARWEPLPGLWCAAQAGFDDINAGIVGVNDNDATTITALVLGGGYSAKTEAGAFSTYAEAGYTHYLWGNYDGTQNPPGEINPFLRFIYRHPVDGGSVLLPLTSPYGPGALWLESSGEWLWASSGLGIGYQFLLLSKNSAANLIDTPYYGDLTAIETAHKTLFASIATPVGWHSDIYDFYIAPELVIKDAQFGFNLSVGAGMQLSSD